MIEVLVVIAIIGILVALLLPAIQAARESARRTQCRSHLKQIGLAMHQFHDVHKGFPVHRGFPGTFSDRSLDQGVMLTDGPVGMSGVFTWVWEMIPFLEQTPMLALFGDDLTLNAYVLGLPIEVMNCPSRRPAIAHPRNQWVRAVDAKYVARADYAINGGELIGPVLPGRSGHLDTLSIDNGIVQPLLKNKPLNEPPIINRVGTLESVSPRLPDRLKFVHVTDGLSKTYLVGEKYVNAEHYLTGLDPGDVQPMFREPGYGTTRYGGQMLPPEQDQPGKTNTRIFGSAHPGSVNALFCDGSVHAINYSIDPTTHGHLANRHDEQVIDDSMF